MKPTSNWFRGNDSDDDTSSTTSIREEYHEFRCYQNKNHPSRNYTEITDGGECSLELSRGTHRSPRRQRDDSIDQVNHLIDLFAIEEYTLFQASLKPSVILSFPDQTGLIPYGGNYHGKNISLFFDLYHHHVTHVSGTRSMTMSEGDRVFSLLHLIQRTGGETFSLELLLIFTFDSHEQLMRIDFRFETGPLVKHYLLLKQKE